jgi:hypothetical protein
VNIGRSASPGERQDAVEVAAGALIGEVRVCAGDQEDKT